MGTPAIPATADSPQGRLCKLEARKGLKADLHVRVRKRRKGVRARMRCSAPSEVDACVLKLGLDGQAAPDLDDEVGDILVQDLRDSNKRSVKPLK